MTKMHALQLRCNEIIIIVQHGSTVGPFPPFSIRSFDVDNVIIIKYNYCYNIVLLSSLLPHAYSDVMMYNIIIYGYRYIHGCCFFSRSVFSRTFRWAWVLLAGNPKITRRNSVIVCRI